MDSDSESGSASNQISPGLQTAWPNQSPNNVQPVLRLRLRTEDQEVSLGHTTSRSPPSDCSIISDSQKDLFEDEITVEAEDIEQKTISRNLPNNNVPEKIVLCVDTSEDVNHTPFKLGDGTKYPPLYMIKRVTEMFMYLKNTIKKCHEFALVVLHDNSVSWVHDFTSDPRLIINQLEKLSPTEQGETFDLSSLFNVLQKNIPLPPAVINQAIDVPAFVPRVILLYSRSYCMPQFCLGQDSFDFLNRCVYFTLDVIYIHESASEDNRCEEIFRVLNELDNYGFSYMFNVLRNATKLHDNMAKLLAHPLQRPMQKQAAYKL